MAVEGQSSTKYDLNSFRWSEEEYSLRELIERFGHQLPFLVTATAGYMGIEDWLGGVATNEIQWLHGFARQKRLVIKDQNDVYYSVPRCYSGMVVPIRPDGLAHRKTNIGDVIENGKYEYLEFCDKKVSVKIKGRLKIIESYDERYLVGHVICDGALVDEFTLTPCSVPILMSIALTSTTGGQKTFFTIMSEFRNFINRCPHDYTEALNQFSEISVFKGTPQTGEYDYITSVPLLLASRIPDDEVKSETKSRLYEKCIPTAYGIITEDRVRQLKHVFYTGKIPENDNNEVTEPEREGKPSKTVLKKRKIPKVKIKNLFKGKSKEVQSKVTKDPEPDKDRKTMERLPTKQSDEIQRRQSDNDVYEQLTSKRGFTSLGQVPSDISSLTVDEVGVCLDLLRLSRHKETLSHRLVDGEMLRCLTESILINEFCLSEFEAKQLSRFAKGYRPKMN